MTTSQPVTIDGTLYTLVRPSADYPYAELFVYCGEYSESDEPRKPEYTANTQYAVVRCQGGAPLTAVETGLLIAAARDWATTRAIAAEASEQAERGAQFAAMMAAPSVAQCPHYTEDQGCPLHGEVCPGKGWE